MLSVTDLCKAASALTDPMSTRVERERLSALLLAEAAKRENDQSGDCACNLRCGDVAQEDDREFAVCKGLPV